MQEATLEPLIAKTEAAMVWVRPWRRAIALLAGMLLISGCMAARGRLVLVDEAGDLNQARLEAAAEPLIGRGAVVFVVLVGSGDDRGEDFARRLDAAGLLHGSEIVPEGIGLYVSREPRYSELRAGSRWSRALPDEALRTIRQETLNPALRAGSFADGVAAVLAALDTRIANTSTLWDTVSRVLFYIVVLPVVLYFVGLFFDDQVRWLKNRWLESPPGRLLAWLWEQTPPGRRRAQRLRMYQLARARSELERLADDARYWCRQAASVSKRKQPIDYLARLRPLDQQRKRLERERSEQAALLQELTALATQYSVLADEARQASPERPAKPKHDRQASAASFYSAPASDYTPPSSSSSSYDSSISYDSGSSGSSGGESSDGGSW